VLLNNALGLTRTLTLKASPNPALEPLDTVRVVFDDGRVEQHLVDVVSIGLGTEQIELATRTTAKPGAAGALAWAPFAETRRVFTGDDVWRELRGATVSERVRRRSRPRERVAT
jgi:hypothetical protein